MTSEVRRGYGRASVPSPLSRETGLRLPEAGRDVHETVLPNGVRVLSEHISSVRSAAVGVWVRQGAAHESEPTTGASHLLEHMVFKGTAKRTAKEIALALEGLGGSLDAYTSREHTSYQARVLDEHLDDAIDVLADLSLHPALREEDLELEREVVLEEIAQVEDTPDDLVFELHTERLWGGHEYGRSILGTKESVASMSAATLRDLHGSRYRGDNLIVAAAGNVRHEALLGRAEELFGDLDAGQRNPSVPEAPATSVGDDRIGRACAQSHVVFGVGVPGHAHPDRYPLVLLSSALGGGMSSRLFQKVREEMGLCYSVYTFQSFYSVGGTWGVYVGTRPATEEKAVDAIRNELVEAAENGLPEAELEQTKRQLKGQIMLSLESTGSRLYRLASFALHEEPFLDLDGVLAKIDAVSSEDVRRVAAEYLHPDRHLVLRMGPDEA